MVSEVIESEDKWCERRVKAMPLIEKGVNQDAKDASTANLLSFSGYTTKKVYDAVKGQHQKTLL
ncbi:MAG: hypothetical protein ABR909_05860 [Candidatus Bathyarchaeia archaeon]